MTTATDDKDCEESLAPYITPKEGGILLKILLQPRASKNELAGTQDDRLKVRLKAPPVEGEANKALVTYIAKLFNIKKLQIEITTGLASRRKSVYIEGFSKEEALNRLTASK